ncbi:MAG TPA: hypothetical protein VM166_03325 [Gemmatimonadaceae bacterium]|nr:hypothetical protein [Gemmatimonadaceae bacterium]
MRALSYLSAGLLLVTASIAGAQANHIALGDKEYVAMNAAAALQHYEAAIAEDPKNGEALWKASRSAVDLGEYEQSDSKRETSFKTAEAFARRAVAANPADAEAHFSLARALGKYALSQGPRARVKYGTEVRAEALECLRLSSKHPGCLNVMGMWNAEVMRLNGFTRMLAKNVLGGKVFGSANWADARRYLEESVAAEPDRIVHHLHLAGVYKDIGEKAKARAEYEAAMKLPNRDFNDRHYKAEADAGMRKS